MTIPPSPFSRRARSQRGRARRWRSALLLGVALAVLAVLVLDGSAESQERAGPTVLVTTLAEPITPVIADHIADGLERASREGHEAYVIQLDTPGGLDVSMREIVQDVLAAEVPVVVHVYPAGGRAASAGAVITLSAHVAAMAPGTTIGSATPIDLEGGEVIDKVLEDAAAYSKELARVRGRNLDFAVDMVREGRSVTADEAVELGVVEVTAVSSAELLDEIDGTEVQLLDGTTVSLATADAAIEEHDLTTSRRILQFLANPNLAFLLLSIGTLGIIYELASPGIGVGGFIGVSALVLGLFSLAVLPTSAVGVVFLLLAAGFFAAELFAPGIGVFAAIGAVALILAALFLFTEEGPGVELSLAAVIPAAVVMFVAVVIAGRVALRVRRLPASDESVFRGVEVEVRGGGSGAQVFVAGAWWAARAVDGRPLAAGQRVRVQRRDDLELIVEPIDGAEADGGAGAGTANPHEPERADFERKRNG
jgi:membrane-bound serine protease (ClpP class)